MSEVHVTGLKEAEELFAQFNAKDMRSILVQTFRRATKPVAQEMRQLVPVGPGYLGIEGWLRDSIGIITLREDIGVMIGSRIRNGYRGRLGPVFEYGSGERHRRTKGGASTGRVPKYRWMSLAVDMTLEYVNQ